MPPRLREGAEPFDYDTEKTLSPHQSHHILIRDRWNIVVGIVDEFSLVPNFLFVLS